MRVSLRLVLRELLEKGTVGDTKQTPLRSLIRLRPGRQWAHGSGGLSEACPSLPLQHLQQHESGVEGESCYYHCVLCNYSTKAKLNLIQHVRSMKHQRSESLRKLQRLQKGLPEEDEDLGQIFTIRRCPSTDPGERARAWPAPRGLPRALAPCSRPSWARLASQVAVVSWKERSRGAAFFFFF